MAQKKNLYKPGAIDCVCGCGRKTNIGRYAFWHVNHSVPRLQVPCSCGCGDLTSGKVDILTREPAHRIHHHGRDIQKTPSESLCACGCGRAVSRKRLDWKYASWHTKHVDRSLSVECLCGCGEVTEGRIRPGDGEVCRFVRGHAQLFGPPKWGRGREFRTNIEGLVEKVLVGLGIGYEFEYPLFMFHIDFALVEEKIAIEADGSYWHGLRKNIFHGKRRDSYLHNHGWRVAHLPEKEILADPLQCVSSALRSFGVIG